MWMAERFLPGHLKDKVRRYYVEVWSQVTGEKGWGGGAAGLKAGVARVLGWEEICWMERLQRHGQLSGAAGP